MPRTNPFVGRQKNLQFHHLCGPYLWGAFEPHQVDGFLPVDKKTTKRHLEASLHMTWLGQGHWDWFPTHELAQRLFFHFAIWDTIQYYAVCNKTLLGPFLKHWQATMGHKPNA